jgi:hypothetical protein
MSLQPQAIYCVPEETARVARAIFPAGNLVMRIYDELNMLVGDSDFAELYREPSASDLSGLPAIATLRQVWIQNFVCSDGQLTWRENDNTLPSGRYISSPYDRDARYATKRLEGRKREQTEQYKAEYAKRAGVEGTIAQSVRTTKVRRARYSDRLPVVSGVRGA